jgi:hypothetical protein
MAKISIKLSSLFKVTLVFSFVSITFLISPHVVDVNIQVNAATPGRLLGYEQTYNADRSANTTLVSVDQSTGAATPLGQKLESSITGTSQFDQRRMTIDSADHKIFFIAENLNGDYMQNDIVVQDSQTGAILHQIPVSLDLINSGVPFLYDSSTGRLLGYEQTYNADGSANTTLVSIDQSTGAATPLGQTLETSVVGTTQFDQNRMTIDSADHKIFFIAENLNGDYMQNDIVVQDTQTGSILNQIPVTLDLINSGAPLIYDSSTGRLLSYEQTYNADRSANTTLVSIDQSTGVLTPLGQTLESSITGTSQFDLGRFTFDAGGHRIFFIAENLNGDYMQNNIVVQDSQTGAILVQIPVSLDLINSGVPLLYEPPPPPQLTSLAPAQVWMSHGTLDAGIRLDIQAQAYVNGNLVSSGEIDSVNVGSNVGPGGITQQTIPFNSFSPINFPSGSTLSLKVSARNACSGSGRNSGNANLWYNTSTRNSNFGATIDTNENIYYLLNNFLLGASAGSGPLKLSTVQAGAKCSSFQSFGTWSSTP